MTDEQQKRPTLVTVTAVIYLGDACIMWIHVHHSKIGLDAYLVTMNRRWMIVFRDVFWIVLHVKRFPSLIGQVLNIPLVKCLAALRPLRCSTRQWSVGFNDRDLYKYHRPRAIFWHLAWYRPSESVLSACVFMRFLTQKNSWKRTLKLMSDFPEICHNSLSLTIKIERNLFPFTWSNGFVYKIISLSSIRKPKNYRKPSKKTGNFFLNLLM